MWVKSLGQEDPLEEKMATHSSIFDGRISWTEEPGGLQPMGLQRVEHNRASEHFTYFCVSFFLNHVFYLEVAFIL